jgi:asparagine synthase (glutamine-hydrolysing)
MIWLEFRQRLPELLLMRVDKMSMATSIESRVPFLDHRMVEYTMQLPVGLKLREGMTKYILKKAVEGIIPDEIIYRKKQGFAAPMEEWIRDPWYPFVRDLFDRSPLVRAGYFDRTYLDAILASHRSARRNTGQLLWNLVNLMMWYEVWFERSSR